MIGRTLPLGELILVVENECLVVEQVELEAKVVHGGEPRVLAATGIEVLVARVERQREQALGTPFEAVLAAVAGLDGGAAIARKHVDNLFVEVLLRRGLRARFEIEHEH